MNTKFINCKKISPTIHGQHETDKNEKELESLIQAVRIYSDDRGIEFGIEKCAILIMLSRKRQMTERIELPNQEKIRMLGEKETCKYLGILEMDTIKQHSITYKTKKKTSQPLLIKLEKLI